MIPDPRRPALLSLALLSLALLSATFLTPPHVWADPPPGYYDSVDAGSPAALRATLHAVIDDHTKFPYSSSSTDTWDILEQADEDPNNASNILDVYKNSSLAKFGGGQGPYNREHTWPNSYGFPDNGDTNYPYSDCHHLFLCDVAYNGDRANYPYDDVSAAATERVTLVNDGQGGGSGVYPGNSNWFSGSRWQTWVGRKGDVARAILYLDVRYEGGTHGITGFAEPDLIVTDDAGLIVTTGNNASVAYMGMLATLRQWHADDPPDAREAVRNDAIFSYQGNRNPFIDHPEWVEALYGDATDARTVPVVARIQSIHPNPANPMSNVTFSLATAGDVRIDVFSVDGRRVRTLIDRSYPSGTFQVRWDGADGRGVTATSGTYVLRLSGNGVVDTAKLVLVK